MAEEVINTRTRRARRGTEVTGAQSHGGPRYGLAWLLIAGTVLTGAIVERTYAQAKPPAKPAAGTAKPAAKTTLSGIYTAAQASKGEEMYYSLCISCHPKGTYAGIGFKNNWNNRPLWDLWDWISNKMPKNDPGSLTQAEVLQVMAYILQQNKMPAGAAPLQANETELYKIKIQIK